MKKINDYMKPDDFVNEVKKQSPIASYEKFKEYFPNGRGTVGIYEEGNNDGPWTAMTYSCDPDGIEFCLEDKEGNLDGLTLEWEKDVQAVLVWTRKTPKVVRICTVDGKYLEIV